MKIYQVYVCDPDKNTKCSKSHCQSLCKSTAFKEYATRDENGAPIVAEEFERLFYPVIKRTEEGNT